jgi:choline kinase
MRALILSAGRGTRMLPLTKNTPKCLLEIGDGDSVLEWQLKEIRKSPHISEIVIVVGYLASQVEAKLEPFIKDMKIEIVYNPFYDVSNNLISVWTAIHKIDTDFIIINGDNIFNQKLLNTIMEDKREGFIIAIDKKEEYDDDDMKVIIENGRIVRISKEVSNEKAAGEAGGFHKIVGRKYINLFKKVILRAIREPKSRNEFYLELFNRLADNGTVIEYVEVDRNDWAEIDFHPDLKIIRDNYSQYLNALIRLK